MKLWQGYINDRKKEEKNKKEKQEKKRERQKERKSKIVNLAYLAEHQISMFYRGELDLNILVHSFETRNFVR